jgi:hypothetical protein
LPRRRMKITTANKAARTPAIRRTVVESMDIISFSPLIGRRLHIFNHGDQVAHQARDHRTDGHHE